MTDDTIAGVVIAAGVVLVIGLIALYWRQRLRFMGRVDPVITASIRWWRGPLGIGWRQCLIRLGGERMSYRRRISFRSSAALEFARSDLTVVDRKSPTWIDWLWLGQSELVTLKGPNRNLELAMLPPEAALFVDWLGDETAPAAPGRNRFVLVGIAAYVAVAVLFFAFVNPKPWLLLIFPIGILAVNLGWSLVGRRLAASKAVRDEFVVTAGDVFGFLHDFGFTNSYAQHLPWRASLLFDDDAARLVIITIDRRRELLDLEMVDEEPDPPRTRHLRDVLAEAGHPDSDRVTRYTGVDGPLRAALEANAHALRLWGREFLTESRV